MGIFGLNFKSKSDKNTENADSTMVKSVTEEVYRRQLSDLNNLCKGSQIKFGVPYFDVFDPRFTDLGVPVAVYGSLTYGIDDIDKFKKLNKDGNYSDSVFENNLKAHLSKYIKSVVTNLPIDMNLNVLHIERKILDVSNMVQKMVTPQIECTFGINVRSLDISGITIDKDSRGYRELKAITSDLEKENIVAHFTLQQEHMRRMQEMNLMGQEEMQNMHLEHQRETLRIQREELQRAARLQTETNFLSAHQVDLNAQVQISDAQSKWSGTKTGNVACMPSIPEMPPIPCTVPQIQYMVGINGQQTGPYDWQQLQQLARQGMLTKQTYVWKQGMAQWDFAGNIAELTSLFN